MKPVLSPYIRLFLNKGIKWEYFIDNNLSTRAASENKLLFIHIGYMGSILNRDYSANLFSDPEVIEIINKNFIPVIIDREEKPETFLLGLDLLRLEHDFSHGPINIFALPDKNPLLSFSNMTPEEFIEIADNLVIANNNKRDQLEILAREMADTIRETGLVTSINNKNLINKESLDEYFSSWQEIDFSQYIFNKLKPYTPDPLFVYLMEYAFSADIQSLKTLIANYSDHLIYSSLFDPVDGGMFRQATDFSCIKPLFEKTLVDNAGFLLYFSFAYKNYKKERYLDAANSIFNFIKNELSEDGGGLYSCSTLITPLQDSHYYFFTLNELYYLLGDKYQSISAALNMNPFEEIHTKQLPTGGVSVMQKLDKKIIELLAARRKEHTGLFTDKRVITAYNAEAIHAVATAGMLLDIEEMKDFAKEKADYLLSSVTHGSHISCRCLCKEEKSMPASLSDYTYFTRALITMYRATGEEDYLQRASAMADTSIELFFKKENGMFAKSSGEEHVFPFSRESNTDNIKPALNSVATGNLISLYNLTGNTKYRDIAEVQINNIIPAMLNNGQMLLSWGYQMMRFLSGDKSIPV